MRPDAADPTHAPKLIYVTPSHQYPTGAVMSLPRRQQLLAAAQQHGAWVLEDDYDSEYRFSGPPLSSLAGLDTDGRVLYMGTFSKVLYPGIKLGYLVVPKALVEPFRQAHYDLNRPGQMPLQAALAEFIEMGHFSSALRRARQSYAERRQCLLEALAPCLALGGGTDAPRISGAEQGLHLCLHLPRSVDDRALAELHRQARAERAPALCLLPGAQRPSRSHHRLRLRAAGRHSARRPTAGPPDTGARGHPATGEGRAHSAPVNQFRQTGGNHREHHHQEQRQHLDRQEHQR